MTFSTDVSCKGMVNTYGVYMQITVKAHQCPLGVTGRWPIVFIASTATGTQDISRCCCEYLVMMGRILA